MQIKEELIARIKLDLAEVGQSFDPGNVSSFIRWMKVEYVNYMLLSREAALETLGRLRVVYAGYGPLIGVLERHINEYASLQCFYRVSVDYISELEQV